MTATDPLPRESPIPMSDRNTPGDDEAVRREILALEIENSGAAAHSQWAKDLREGKATMVSAAQALAAMSSYHAHMSETLRAALAASEAREKELREKLQNLANAADDVGVRFFDTDTMEPEVEAMQKATLDARALLAPKQGEG